MVVRTGCAIAAAAVLIVGGCGADAPTAGSVRVEEATDELDRARARWADADIASYTLSVAEDVNAWGAGCTWVVEVSDGIVTDSESARPSSTASDCFPVEWTVEQLHQMISGWIADVGRYPDPEFGQHTLDVRYDDSGVREEGFPQCRYGDDGRPPGSTPRRTGRTWT